MDKRAASQKQVDRFRNVAQELECDKNEAAFEDKLRRIAQQKPEKEKSSDK